MAKKRANSNQSKGTAIVPKISSDRKKLEAEYRKLAKRADQRLVRLEGYRHDKGFKGITEYAYKTAMRDIASYSGKGAKRFNTKAPATDAELKRKIADIKKFLAAKSSTKKGVLDTYKKRADSLNKSMGTNFTWQEWANYWEKVGADDFDKNIDYRTGAQILSKQKELGINDKNFKSKMQELVRDGEINKVEQNVFNRLNEIGVNYSMLKP